MRQRTQRITTLVVILLVGTVSLLVWQERSDPTSPSPVSKMLGLSQPPSIFESDITEWTPVIRRTIAAAEWETLARDLARLHDRQPKVYMDQHLDYLHARALIETGKLDEAEELLTPYVLPDHPFRVLALQHTERIAVEHGDQQRASDLRRTLIREFPGSFWQRDAVEREVESLAEDPRSLIAFSRMFGGSVEASLRRDIESRVVEALVALDRRSEAARLGFNLLEQSVMDDAGERVWRVLDHPSMINRYDARQRHLLAQTAHSHRHFVRAAEILSELESKIPAKADEIRFAIGRAFFWDEQYAEAEAAYLRGASLTSDREEKAKSYYHAARAAQLQGKDDEAERWLTRSIAVPGRFGATAASLTQRMRTRLDQKRWSDASHDVQLLRRLFPRGESVFEASIGYAVAAVAAGDRGQALRTLGRIPRQSTDAYDRAEIDYWRGRAFEPDNPLAALDEYLGILRSDVQSHYKWFVRERLKQPAIAREVEAAIERRRPRIATAIAGGNWDLARELQSDVVAMKPGDPSKLARLRSIYEHLPAYAEVLELRPEALPSLPLTGGTAVTAGASVESSEDATITVLEHDRGEILIALGLEQEAVDRITELYPLRPKRSALTQSLAQRLAGATKPSIYAIEVMMRSVPDDYVYELLPDHVRELLYPNYFEELVLEKSEEYGADPTLLRSIMREESRFDPKAKSFAAARGLLQFIISTAKQIGASIGLTEMESGDLYEPETIIRLGAKYVADLLEQFDGNRYHTAAAYNAGPHQAALWARLASGEEDDYFYAAINFDETRHYVRKVLNSFYRYEDKMADANERAPDVTE